MSLTVTPTEFARRLCVREHPHFASTGARIPCGTHTALAQRLWGLLRPDGIAVLEVIVQIRSDSGYDLPQVTGEVILHE
jgi:hypothetical protein